jgi:hypothetical protein
MGLGGWMYNGVDRHTVLGGSGDPNVPGLGFRYIQTRGGLYLTRQDCREFLKDIVLLIIKI